MKNITYKSQPASSNLAAWYPINYDDGAGLEDKSGNGYDLTGTASASFWTGTLGRGTFDGSSDDFIYSDTTTLELGTATGPKTQIVSFRVNAAAAAATGDLLGKRGATQGLSFELVVTTGLLRCNFSNAANFLSSTAVADSADHHVVYVADGSNEYIYLDNAQDNSRAQTSQDCVGTAVAFQIGGRRSTTPMGWKACGLWDVQVYLPAAIDTADRANLVDWLYKHPYQPIPASLW